MNKLRGIAIGALLVAFCGIAIWCFIGWSINRAFQSAREEGDFKKISDVVQASVGSALATGEVKSVGSEGVLNIYRRDTQRLKRDRAYFATLTAALNVAHSASLSKNKAEKWQSSGQLGSVLPSERTDAWGHQFCVESNRQQTVVVSAGPKALSGLDCNSLSIESIELMNLPKGRLNQHPSGALILLLPNSSSSL